MKLNELLREIEVQLDECRRRREPLHEASEYLGTLVAVIRSLLVACEEVKAECSLLPSDVDTKWRRNQIRDALAKAEDLVKH